MFGLIVHFFHPFLYLSNYFTNNKDAFRNDFDKMKSSSKQKYVEEYPYQLFIYDFNYY